MKRYVYVFFCLLFVLAALTGCAGKDGHTVDLSYTVSVQKDTYDALVKKGIHPFSTDPTEIRIADGKQMIFFTQTLSDIGFSEAEAKLKAITLYSKEGTPSVLMKSTELKQSSGLFYSSCTMKAVTNKLDSDTWSLTIMIGMPGSIAQIQGGAVTDKSATFELSNLTAENEIAAYSESNNVAAVLIIIGILLAVGGGFVWIIKRKQD